MPMYASVVLSELHLHPTTASLTTSRRAASRYAELEALREAHHPPQRPARLPFARRLRALGRRLQRTPA